MDYDEFRAFDVRVTGDGGLGYKFIDAEDHWVVARVGVSVSREYGGVKDREVPEYLCGLECEHNLSSRQKITVSVEYYPDMEQPGEFRLNAKAEWEVLLDPEWGLNLKLTANERYDSTPEGLQHSDIDYAALFAWKL